MCDLVLLLRETSLGTNTMNIFAQNLTVAGKGLLMPYGENGAIVALPACLPVFICFPFAQAIVRRQSCRPLNGICCDFASPRSISLPCAQFANIGLRVQPYVSFRYHDSRSL